MAQQHRIKKVVVGLALSALTSLALASGSDAVGSAQTGDRADYNKGKRVYAVKIACETCPMAGKKLNKETAKSLLMGGLGSNLTSKEQQALTVYLERRFRL